MKIVNFSKFIRSTMILIGVIIGISILLSNISLSHTEMSYKTVYVGTGDTLWSIAKTEKEMNSFYENRDVREIVNSIKTINKLSTSNLKPNQQLLIPEI